MLTSNNTNKRRPRRLPPPIPKEVRQISTPPPPQLSTPLSTTTTPTEFHLFWDYENVSLPSNSNPAAVGKALFQIFFTHFLSLGGIRTSPKTCSLYFSDNDSAKMTTDLAQSWNLRYIPNPKKKPQIVDFAIIRDLQSIEARQNTLFIGIITGDSDFVNGASHLQDLGHHVYTVLPRNAGHALETLPCLGRFPKDVLPQHTRRLCLGNSGNAITSIVSGNAGHAASESSSVSLSNTRLLTPSKVIVKQQKKQQKKKQQKKKDKQKKRDEQKKQQEEERKKQEEQKKQNTDSIGNGTSAKVDEDRGQKSSALRLGGADSSKKEARSSRSVVRAAAASKNKKTAVDKEKQKQRKEEQQPKPKPKPQQPQNSCNESTTNDFMAQTSEPVTLRINYSSYRCWKEDENTDCLKEEKEKDAEDEILLTATGTSSFHYNNLKSW